jgi:hypothetical protein
MLFLFYLFCLCLLRLIVVVVKLITPKGSRAIWKIQKTLWSENSWGWKFNNVNFKKIRIEKIFLDPHFWKVPVWETWKKIFRSLSRRYESWWGLRVRAKKKSWKIFDILKFNFSKNFVSNFFLREAQTCPMEYSHKEDGHSPTFISFKIFWDVASGKNRYL